MRSLSSLAAAVQNMGRIRDDRVHINEIREILAEWGGALLSHFLYLRGIYPSEAFKSSQYAGYAYQAARAGGVASYLSSSLGDVCAAWDPRSRSRLKLLVLDHNDRLRELEALAFTFWDINLRMYVDLDGELERLRTEMGKTLGDFASRIRAREYDPTQDLCFRIVLECSEGMSELVQGENSKTEWFGYKSTESSSGMGTFPLFQMLENEFFKVDGFHIRAAEPV